MGLPRFKRALAPLAFASSCAIALALAGAARAADVVVPGSTDFPESMSASSDGTLYFSSFGNGRVWRAKPGEAQASEFIKTGSNGLASALGVLADDKSNTLYVCSDDFSAGRHQNSRRSRRRRSSCSTSRPARPRAASPCRDRRPCAMTSSSPTMGTPMSPIPSPATFCGSSPARRNSRSGRSDPRWDVPGKRATGRHRHAPRRLDLRQSSSKATDSIASR